MIYVVYALYILISAGLFYMGIDIIKNKNLYKYTFVEKEKLEALDGFNKICGAFGKIPMVAGGVALSGIVLTMVIGVFSLMLTLGMLLVVGFIWASSVKNLKNL
ncbi:MAG: hypothetical protein ACRC7N_21735 [Clostridium sp.]